MTDAPPRQEDAADVLAREAAFWDAEEAAEELFYREPHDWVFDRDLANAIQAPVFRFLIALRGRGVRSVLDLGCGNGIYSRLMALHGGVRVFGADVSAAKIAKARALAEKEGIADRVTYEVASVLDYTAPEPVDLVCAFGVLHHLPEVEVHVPAILERNLKPGGLLVAVEPCFEGLSPGLMRFGHWLGGSRFRHHFDFARYEKHLTEVAAGATTRGESPAGLAFHREDFALDRWLRATFDPVRIRYANVIAPFFANAFVVYQKSERVRRWARRLMPSVVRLDGLLCRIPRFRRHANIGMYALSRKKR